MHRVENPRRLCRVGFCVLLPPLSEFLPCSTNKATYYQTEQHKVSRPHQSRYRCIRNKRFRSNPAVLSLMIQRPIEERPDLAKEAGVLELESQGHHTIAKSKNTYKIVVGGNDRNCDLQPIRGRFVHEAVLNGSTFDPNRTVDAIKGHLSTLKGKKKTPRHTSYQNPANVQLIHWPAPALGPWPTRRV